MLSRSSLFYVHESMKRLCTINVYTISLFDGSELKRFKHFMCLHKRLSLALTALPASNACINTAKSFFPHSNCTPKTRKWKLGRRRMVMMIEKSKKGCKRRWHGILKQYLPRSDIISIICYAKSISHLAPYGSRRRKAQWIRRNGSQSQ
jgi:hypothetical protein